MPASMSLRPNWDRCLRLTASIILFTNHQHKQNIETIFNILITLWLLRMKNIKKRKKTILFLLERQQMMLIKKMYISQDKWLNSFVLHRCEIEEIRVTLILAFRFSIKLYTIKQERTCFKWTMGLIYISPL
jgi:hypothetical protein